MLAERYRENPELAWGDMEILDAGRSAAGRARCVDRLLLRWVTGHHSPALDRWMPRASRAADHLLGWWAVAAVMTATGDPAVRSAARRGVAAMLPAGPVCNAAAKRMVDRSRPPRSLRRGRPGRVPDTGGFPSGHTAAATAFTVAVTLTVPRAGVPVGVLAAAVAYSSLYTGAHYPSDVAAGALAGAAVALVLRGPARGRRFRTPRQGMDGSRNTQKDATVQSATRTDDQVQGGDRP